MREIADDEAGVADVSTVPQSFEGSERVLACFQLLEIEPESSPTTKLIDKRPMQVGFFVDSSGGLPKKPRRLSAF